MVQINIPQKTGIKKYQGTVTMTEALNHSWNAPAVWLLDKIGLKKGIEKVHQFGIETDPGDEYLGIALGGLTKGLPRTNGLCLYSLCQ